MSWRGRGRWRGAQSSTPRSVGMADAIVVGGGVMGLAAARELRQRGHDVTLLERAQPGRAASWASAGIIGATMRVESDPQHELRRVSRAMWPAFVEALTAESGLDPEYREMGCIQLATDDAELEVLARAGENVDGARYLDHTALRELEPSIGPGVPGGLLVPGGNVDNRRLCRALEIAVRRAGVRIETGTEVRALVTGGQRVSGVETGTRRIAADLVVLAAGAWSAMIR